MLLQDVLEALETKEEACSWLRERSLLPRTMSCTRCHSEMTLVATNDAPDFEVFRCMQDDTKRSIRTGSFAFQSNLPLKKLVLLMYYWAIDTPNKTIQAELELSAKTVSKWMSFCRQTVDRFISNPVHALAIGGQFAIVEIDETMLCRRKYNRGRMASQIWLFGGIERSTVGTGRAFAEIVADRTQSTLIEIIQRRILSGTMIMSDGWGAYRNLSRYGYRHGVVNHSKNFVNPADSTIHTQGIENFWGHLKRWLRRKGTNIGGDHQAYINEYLYKKRFIEVFDTFITHLAMLPSK